MKVLYYGLGGGHGHAVRGLALLRRLPEVLPGSSSLLLIPSHLAALARGEGVACEHPPEDPDKAELAAWAAEAAERFSPDLVLVDYFPRGVLGELGDAFFSGRRAWLVSRIGRPDYYLAPEVREAVEARYEGVLWGEEPPPALRGLGRRSEGPGPILIRRPEECLGREEARRELGAPEHGRLVLLLGEDKLARVTAKALARIGGASLRVGAPFPAMRVLRAADAVVCAAGYHAFHETRALGVPAVFVPQDRLYDEQDRRAQGVRTARSPQELETGLREALAEGPSAAGPFKDGALRAWEAVLGTPARNAAHRAGAGTGRSCGRPSAGVPG